MVKLGVILFAATLALLVAEFLRRRARAYPMYGWIGLVCLIVSEFLMFRGIEPVASFFTPIAWTCYALIADAAVFAIRGRSRLRSAPGQFARLALLSIPLWLIFEAYNLRLANWIYVGGIPLSFPFTWLAYAWAFATIWPGIFLTADLIESFGWWEGPLQPIRFSRTTQNVFMIAGAVLVSVPVILPARLGAYLFGAVWVGFVFLLDPMNSRLGLPSFETDLAVGRPGRFSSFLASGWVCGWLWEFWNYWAARKWNYTFPIMQREKIFEMPALGYLGFLPFALECFVMYYFAAWILRWEKPLLKPAVNESHAQTATALLRCWPFVLVLVAIAAFTVAQPAYASSLDLPQPAKDGLEMLYAGAPGSAIPEFRQVQAELPDSPLGYLLEAEARWWQIYCEACEIKWNTIDAWDRPKIAEDDDYLALAAKATSIAESRIARQDSAEMRLYAGIGWSFRARLLGLRGDRRATARAGVNAHKHLLRCLELDPQMADADAGLGLYNYYVDTLSPIARVLRFFMGIPGGSKQDGIRQLETAMQSGTLTRVEARFYLAKNLRMYDHDYARALDVAQPLIDQFPHNPIFQLLEGDIQAKLGHSKPAAASFREALESSAGDSLCERHIRSLAQQSTTLLAGVRSGQ